MLHLFLHLGSSGLTALLRYLQFEMGFSLRGKKAEQSWQFVHAKKGHPHHPIAPAHPTRSVQKLS